MRWSMIALGLVRTLFGRDYRSSGLRRQLGRMGHEFLNECFDHSGGDYDECETHR